MRRSFKYWEALWDYILEEIKKRDDRNLFVWLMNQRKVFDRKVREGEIKL